jgi:glycosyltransferase involved in cell wall biosynthesis
MRIAIMLRSILEQGGVGVYSRYITQELLQLDQRNEYVLFYSSPERLGEFASYPNVIERVVQAPNKALWDQVAIPYACWREQVDVVFHPKFTVPLLAPCKSVMVLHGAGWFMPDTRKFWNALDLKYVRMMMPVYCRRASAVLAVSQITTDTFNRVLGLTPGKIRTVYFGPGKHFQPISDPAELERVRHKYSLPDRFIFTLSGHDRGTRKNIDGILKAYRIHHGKTPHKLVVGGKGCDRFRAEYRIPDDGYGQDIHFPGWIDQKDLPAIYSLADLFLYPSFSEAFPIPITEALACGTPIITSTLNGLQEIAGDAALAVDAAVPEEIADAIGQVLLNPDFRETLAARSLARSEMFNWQKCARETLQILESVAGNPN